MLIVRIFPVIVLRRHGGESSVGDFQRNQIAHLLSFRPDSQCGIVGRRIGAERHRDHFGTADSGIIIDDVIADHQPGAGRNRLGKEKEQAIEVVFFLSRVIPAAPRYMAMILEIVLLLLFGIAWLVKGEAFPFLNDVEEETDAVSEAESGGGSRE